jgi:hypothetical protein
VPELIAPEVEISSAQVWTIKYPETVLVLKYTLIVADPEKETVQWISLIHIVAVRRHQTIFLTRLDKADGIMGDHSPQGARDGSGKCGRRPSSFRELGQTSARPG